MEQRRLVGGAAGLLMLVGVFVFGFLNYGLGSMWAIAYDFINDPTTGYADIFATEILFVIAVILIIAGGVTGLWPRASAILGLIGVVTLVVLGYANPSSTVSYGVGDYGVGMYVVIIATVLALLVGFAWHRLKPMTSQPAMPTTAAPPPMAPPQPQAQAPQQMADVARFCPSCGREVTMGSRFCKHCGASLA